MTIQRRLLLLASIEEKKFISERTGKKTTHYFVRYYVGRGKSRKRKSLPGAFTRWHDADVARSRMLAEQAAGTFGQDDQDVLFREEAENWLEQKEPEVRIRTFMDYRQVVNNHLLPCRPNHMTCVCQLSRSHVSGTLTAPLTVCLRGLV